MWSMEVCAPNFRSVTLLVWSGGETNIHKHTYIGVKNINIPYHLLVLRGFYTRESQIKVICRNPCDVTVFQGHFFEKNTNKKTRFRHGPWWCVYGVSGLLRF